MNPEIRKFWQDSGYEVSLCYWENNKEDRFYYVSKENVYFLACKYSTTNDKQASYYYSSYAGVLSRVRYSEEEMLKIIKMKAFI